MLLYDTSSLRTVRHHENKNKSKGILNNEFKTNYLKLNNVIKAVTLNSKLEIIHVLSGLENGKELANKLRSFEK